MRVTRPFALVAVAFLTSCVQVTVVRTHRDAISRDDTAQIKRVVSLRRDIPTDALIIRPLRPDMAAVDSWGGSGYHTLTVRKADGHWEIDDGTVQRHMILH
jgi:predicted methyltransferase